MLRRLLPRHPHRKNQHFILLPKKYGSRLARFSDLLPERKVRLINAPKPRFFSTELTSVKEKLDAFCVLDEDEFEVELLHANFSKALKRMKSEINGEDAIYFKFLKDNEVPRFYENVEIKKVEAILDNNGHLSFPHTEENRKDAAVSKEKVLDEISNDESSPQVSQAPLEAWTVTLDGLQIYTRRKKPLIVPTIEMARLIASELECQQGNLQYPLMSITNLACKAIDDIPLFREFFVDELVDFARTDHVNFGKDKDDEEEEDVLYTLQDKHHTPIRDWMHTFLGLEYATNFSMFAEPPQETLDALNMYFFLLGPFELVGIHSLVHSCSSVATALALLHGAVSLEGASSSVRLEEDLQVQEHGKVDGSYDLHSAIVKADISAALGFLRAIRAIPPMREVFEEYDNPGLTLKRLKEEKEKKMNDVVNKVMEEVLEKFRGDMEKNVGAEKAAKLVPRTEEEKAVVQSYTEEDYRELLGNDSVKSNVGENKTKDSHSKFENEDAKIEGDDQKKAKEEERVVLNHPKYGPMTEYKDFNRGEGDVDSPGGWSAHPVVAEVPDMVTNPLIESIEKEIEKHETARGEKKLSIEEMNANLKELMKRHKDQRELVERERVEKQLRRGRSSQMSSKEIYELEKGLKEMGLLDELPSFQDWKDEVEEREAKGTEENVGETLTESDIEVLDRGKKKK